MKTIALSGYAKSGKDTVANILVEEFGYKKFAFATKLKECVVALNPIIPYHVSNNLEVSRLPIMMANMTKQNYKLSEWLNDGFTLEEMKEFPEVRRLLQRMGTEVGRKIFGPDFWVDQLLNSDEFINCSKRVITDCRFPEEFNAVGFYMDGQVWRIERPGIGPLNNHISETAIDDFVFDVRVVNSGTIDELKMIVREIIKQEEMEENDTPN